MFSIHRLMASALQRCPPPTDHPALLVLGLGGGCLPTFFASQFPQATITAVDLDAAMVEVARTYFKLPEAVHTVVCDGVEYVKGLAERDEHVDYVFVDIDSKDMQSSASFPPMAFLSVCAVWVSEV